MGEERKGESRRGRREMINVCMLTDGKAAVSA